MKGSYPALLLKERMPVHKANRNKERFRQRYRYWQQFYYNEDQYLQKSLQSMSNMDIEDLSAIEDSTSFIPEASVSQKWHDDWCQILEGKYADVVLPSTLQRKTFSGFTDHFLKYAYSQLQPMMSGEPSISQSETLYGELLNNLSTDLHTMTLRTLVLELNVARESGDLHGFNSQDRYRYFNEEILTNRRFLGYFYEEYTILIRLIIEKIHDWMSFITDIVTHLKEDWEHLKESFSELTYESKVACISTGMGDKHKRGKSVTFVHFENGAVLVYKPRPLAVDNHFQQLVRWLNRGNSDIPDLYEQKIVQRTNHGWAEFIPYRECTTHNDIIHFYERMGAQLALMYVLNATDFHYGNLIASGAHPVPVDLESLFHQGVQQRNFSTEALDQADKILSRSIMATGMLPNLLYQRDSHKQTGIDLSGLSGKGDQELPFDVSMLDGKGTDQASMTRTKGYLEAGNNLPSFQGEYVEVNAYLEQIQEGFTKMYRYLNDHKDAFIQVLNGFWEMPVRTIVRPSMSYGELLRASTHPDLLRDAMDRDLFLHRLWLYCLRFPELERIIVYEKEDLHYGDTPYFTTIPGERHIWSSNGTKIENFFPRSSLSMVIEKVESLEETDLDQQLQVLHMVMLAANASERADVAAIDPFHAVVHGREAPVQRFLTYARDIGDYLLKTGVPGKNGGHIDLTWISTVLEGNHEVVWRMSPVGSDFYNGNSGIALFLGYLANITGDHKYKEAARQAIVPLLADMERYQHHPQWSLGAYSGVGGSIFTVSHLARIWEDDALSQKVTDALYGYRHMVNEDNMFDYIGGSAGALDIFLNVYQHTGEHHALEGAKACADHLMARSQEMSEGGIGWLSVQHNHALTGYSHGNAGIAAVLSSLYRITRDPSLLDVIEKALQFERNYYSPHEKNWQTPGRDHASIAWCHGAPGILLSRLRLKDNGYHDAYIEEEIKTALETTLNQGFGNNRSYCHGDFGQLEILMHANQTLEDIDLTPYIISVQHQLAHFMEEKMWNYGVVRGTESKGLMVGLAGYGMGSLKQFDPQGIPNILSL